MKILFAIDCSHHCDAAVRAMSRRIWPVGSEIKLLGVASHGVDDHVEFMYERAFEEAASMLALGVNGSQVFIHRQLVEGHIRDAIVDVASEWGADLVVVGSRGHSMLESVLLGSVSQAVLDHAKFPVIIAREVQPAAIGNILVGVDDTEHSAAAVEWLAEQTWANIPGTTISLVSAVHDPQPDISHKPIAKAGDLLLEWEAERGLLYLALEYWARFLQEQLPAAEIHYGVLDGEPREVLIRAAQNWPSETIIMGSHGRRGIQKLFLGSVSQHIAAHVNCSVEIIRNRPSQHFAAVHAMLQEHRENNPLHNEPSHQTIGSKQISSPIMFSW